MDTSEAATGAPAARSGRRFGTGRRHRRPSGEPPALPHTLGRSGRFWLALAAYFGLAFLGVLLFNPMSRFFESLDAAVLQRFVALRSPVVNDVSLAVNGLAALWSIRAIRWIVILILVIFRRWRHLLVYVGAILAAGAPRRTRRRCRSGGRDRSA